MTGQTLRDYQAEAVAAVVAAQRAEWLSVLVTLATGAGKTVIASELVRIALSEGKRVLFVAHTQELIGQALKRIQEYCDLDEFDIAPEINVMHAPHSCRVVIGSLLTIQKPERLYWFQPDVIIYDESHRCGSATHKSIKARYPCAFHVGVTATPKRGDKQALACYQMDGTAFKVEKHGVETAATEEDAIFQKHVYQYGLRQAQGDGWIVPFKWLPVPTKTDISRVPLNADGDFQEKALLAATECNDERAVILINAWQKAAADRPTLWFASSVEDAVHTTELLRQAGVLAECILSKEPADPEQKRLVTVESNARFQLLARFNAGKVPIVVNYGTLTEGVDAPACSCIVRARPTTVWSLAIQMYGRGGRPLPGVVDDSMTAEDRIFAIWSSDKPECLIIEPQDIHGKHDPMRLPDILDLPAGVVIEDLDLKSARALLADEKAKLAAAAEEERLKREQIVAPLSMGFGKRSVNLPEPSSEIRTQEKFAQTWGSCDGGFTYKKVPAGYLSEAIELESNVWQVFAVGPNDEVVYNVTKRQKPGEFGSLMKEQTQEIEKAIAAHKDKAERAATFHALTPLERWTFHQEGVSDAEIRGMTLKEAKGKLTSYRIAYRARRMRAEREQSQQQEAA